MIVAPTEPPVIKRLGRTGPQAEAHGVDLFWVAGKARYGIQRKEASDFVASVMDKRLERERALMKRLDVAALVLEGTFRWSTEGEWMGPGRWDRFRHRQYLFSMMDEGIWVIETDSAGGTAEVARELERWSRKESHHRPTREQLVTPWGSVTNRDWWCWLAQSWPGVGPELAEALVSWFGGRLPIRWEVGPHDLEQIPGIGPKRAAALIGAMGQTMGRTGRANGDGGG